MYFGHNSVKLIEEAYKIKMRDMELQHKTSIIASCLFALLVIAHTSFAITLPIYRHLKNSCINPDCSAIRIVVSNPPINLWDANVVVEFNSFLTSLNSQNSTKIVVISSDVPGFYISNLDANIFAASTPSTLNVTDVLTKYFANLALLTSTPVIFIGEVNGRAWGAGDEHLLHMDMRFAGPDAQLSAPEVELGVIHVGGLQLLTKLIGPGRTLEYLLSGAQVDSIEAARVGWVNSAYATEDALRQHVDSLARRIALFPIEAIRATKAGVAEQGPSQTSLQDDMDRYNKLAAMTSVQGNIQKFLILSQNQSREWELNIGDNLLQMYNSGSD